MMHSKLFFFNTGAASLRFWHLGCPETCTGVKILDNLLNRFIRRPQEQDTSEEKSLVKQKVLI